jgi:hypothetical protein
MIFNQSVNLASKKLCERISKESGKKKYQCITREGIESRNEYAPGKVVEKEERIASCRLKYKHIMSICNSSRAAELEKERNKKKGNSR